MGRDTRGLWLQLAYITAFVFLLLISYTLRTKAATPPEQDYIQMLHKLRSPELGAHKKSEAPLVAAQVLLFYAQDLEGLRGEIQALKKAGFNAVIVRVFQNKGDRPYPITGKRYSTPGVYFKTKYAPVIYDLLSPVVEIAHSLNMKVFAWMTTRYCDWAYSVENATYKYDFAKDKIVPSKGLNLFSEKTKKYLSGLYADLAGYDIDGILFQDDLMLRHNEGFSAAAVKAYKAEYGTAPAPQRLYKGVYYDKKANKYYVRYYTDEYVKFAHFKNRKILELAEELMTSARRVNPDIKFALNCYYEAGLMPDKALLWLAQDLRAARKMNFDYFSMMSYQEQIKKELDLTEEESINKVVEIAKRMLDELGSPKKILLKFQTVDWETGKPVNIVAMENMLQRIKRLANFNIALVPYRQKSFFFKMSKLLMEERNYARSYN